MRLFNRLGNSKLQTADNQFPCLGCITVELKGRLGNQLFQFATGLAIAIDSGAALRLTLKANTDFMLSFLDIVPETSYKVFLSGTKISFEISESCNSPKKFVEEKTFRYDEGLRDSLDTHAVIDGYFQSFKYFESISDPLREYIADKLPSPDKPVDWVVGVHVRLGDYVRNESVARVHKTLDENYYLKCLRSLGFESEKSSGNGVMVFTDDPDFLQLNFRTLLAASRLSDPHIPVMDLKLLASSPKIICSNSSFSWWAAWLGDGEVLAPRNWFTTSGPAFELGDLFPEAWIRC